MHHLKFYTFMAVLALLCLVLFPFISNTTAYSAPLPASTSVEMKDITVLPQGDHATITFLVDGSVRTVVIEKKSKDVAQVRMKSIRATDKSLNSALIRSGVRSVNAHIERTDVMVADVRFARSVVEMAVIRRDSNSIVVRVKLGSPTSRSNSDLKGNWKLNKIIIDAGHGGKDPGAIGIDGIREKDITLSVAKKLRDRIRKSYPGVSVVMTRDRDEFVELYRRGEIANQKNGKLFVSIHCNSTDEKPHPANGFECWILRPGNSEVAGDVASRENESVTYEAGDRAYNPSDRDRNGLGSVDQNSFLRFSEELAKSIESSMEKGTPLRNRGTHQAGFYVLNGASMPAILVELGFLSNEEDVKVLKSKSGQDKIAKALFDGIKKYEKFYSTSLN